MPIFSSATVVSVKTLDLLHKLDDSEEVTFVIAPLDKMSKQADNAQAQDAVPMIYSRIIFQPMIKATNSPTV